MRRVVHPLLGSPPGDRRERKPMKRIAFALGLAALFASTSASAIKVPTGNTDYDLNVSVLIQARYEGTFEGSTEKSLDSDFFMRRARLAAGGTAFKVFSFFIHYRLGRWDGFHDTTATTGAAPGPAVNPGGKPMIGGHVRVNFIGDETGYGLNQMYLDGKTRASIGGAVQYQPRAACGGAVTA